MKLPWDSSPSQLPASAHGEAVPSKGFGLTGELPHPGTLAPENSEQNFYSVQYLTDMTFVLLPLSLVPKI